MLSAAGLEPRLLTLELTTGVAQREGPAVIGALNELREFGVRIALDDFGMATSLADLKRLPVDQVKLAREFVGDVTATSDASVFATTLINLADNRGVEVVAKGVESREQAWRLAELGCRFGQGFFFGKPLGAQRDVVGATPRDVARLTVSFQVGRDGAPGGTRTHGLLLRRQTLYPLSYGRQEPRLPQQTCMRLGAKAREHVSRAYFVYVRRGSGAGNARTGTQGRLRRKRSDPSEEGPLHCPGRSNNRSCWEPATPQGHLSRRLHRLP